MTRSRSVLPKPFCTEIAASAYADWYPEAGDAGSSPRMPRDNPSVSVALATYNGAAYLPAQLESLAEQTLQPAELVVGDDGSADGTLEILDRFAGKSPFPVHVTRNERRLGYGDNFLATADRCSGDVVAFCDQDDVWHPDKIAVCADAIVADPSVRAVVHATELVDEELRPLAKHFPAIEATEVRTLRTAYRWLVVPGHALVFDRALLESYEWHARPPSLNLDPLPRAMYHDEWVYFLASSTGPVAYVAQPLGLYRQHQDNAIGGLGARPSLRERAQQLLYEDVFQLALRTTAFGRYAEYLEARASLAHAGRAAGQVAVESWRDVERLHLERGVIYDGSFARRARSLLGLLRDRGYRRTRNGGLGRRALLKDVRQLFIPQRDGLGDARARVLKSAPVREPS